jgi:hypothetical protein
MHPKFSRLRSLLEYADEQQKEISNELSQYLDGDIPPSLRIKTKNYFENARSVLDYIANDICVDVLGLAEKHKCYFPIYSRSPAHFAKFCDANFPGLERLSPELHALLKSIQPFETAEFTALKLLAEYVNENKHRDLTAQALVEEHHAASRFKVVRFGDISELAVTEEKCDGYLVADETRSDPFLGSDYIITQISHPLRGGVNVRDERN